MVEFLFNSSLNFFKCVFFVWWLTVHGLVKREKRLFVVTDTPQNKQIFRIAKRSLYLLAAVGVLMVSFSRTHYTVDIVIAYVITTMLFRIYHTIAAHAHLKVRQVFQSVTEYWTLVRLNLPFGSVVAGTLREQLPLARLVVSLCSPLWNQCPWWQTADAL